jgi:hypothetical protein
MITVNVRLMPHLLFFTIVLYILKVKRQVKVLYL